MKVEEGIISIDVANTNLGSLAPECAFSPILRPLFPALACASPRVADAARRRPAAPLVPI